MRIEPSATEIREEEEFAEGGFAFFRYPCEDTCTFVGSRRPPLVLDSYTMVGKDAGIVVAPWRKSVRTPLLLIRPDTVVQEEVPPGMEEETDGEAVSRTHGRDDYDRGFRYCHERLCRRTDGLHKVVYARSTDVGYPSHKWSCKELFLRACLQSPQSYVSLWYTPQSGCWIVSTPEYLVCSDGNRWRTMALAGTMPWKGDLVPVEIWSRKNRDEQNCVAEYIRQRIADLVTDEEISPCRSVRAGNVMHLRTDFSFSLRQGVSLGTLTGRLHPTPAVCGSPLFTAKSVLRVAERNPRLYYAGFSGPVNIDHRTGLFVSLRCARLDKETATLYAGGGLLAGSICDEEWEETCLKMDLTLRLLRG